MTTPKGWKRISNLTYFQRYENKKTGENLFIVLSSIVQNGWIVYSWKLSKKGFKKKSQALAFAKKYMRSH